ncbi:MAG: SgcJ/EcaC family oxidoreductase [Gemmatimonadota bacterium]|nr:MAG: SgcJ/EcaC family oxidoreductase [Gemmatimonadota bacterium]
MKRTAFLALAALAIFACQPPAQQAGLPDEDVAAINALMDDLVDAELAGNWEGVAELMAEDVVSMPANMPLMQGRDEWAAWVESMGFSVTELTFDIVEMDGRGDLAYLRIAFSEVFTVEGASEPVEETGKCLWMMRKQADGSWLLSTWLCNSDLPPAE